MKYINEAKRFQQLAGLVTEAEENAEQAAEKGLSAMFNNLTKAAATIKPSPKDEEIQEGLITIGALVAGAPGLITLLGQTVDAASSYFSHGAVQKTSIGKALQKAGGKLEHKYIDGIAFLLKKAYPKKFENQNAHDEASELHDAAHGIYAAILAAAAIGSGYEAYNAVNTIVQGLEGGAAAFKTSEVVALAKKIVAA